MGGDARGAGVRTQQGYEVDTPGFVLPVEVLGELEQLAKHEEGLGGGRPSLLLAASGVRHSE
jgi:hypothetical protein